MIFLWLIFMNKQGHQINLIYRTLHWQIKCQVTLQKKDAGINDIKRTQY